MENLEEIDESKIMSTTIGARINVKSLATLTQYYSSQGLRSQGAMIRAALETLATVLIESGKADNFETNAESITYVRAFYPTKGLSYQKAKTDVSPSRFLDKREGIRDSILGGALSALEIRKGEANENS